MLQTILKWKLALVLIPLLFAYWIISLTMAMNANQEVLNKNARLIENLNRLEQSISALENGFPNEKTDAETLNAQWQKLYSEYQTQYVSINNSLFTGNPLRNSLQQINDIVKRMVNIRDRSLEPNILASGYISLKTEFQNEMAGASQEIQSAVKVAQEKFFSLSQNVDSSWNQLQILIVAFCLLVIGLTILLKSYQGDVNFLNQLKKALQIAYEEMDQKVKKHAGGGLSRENTGPPQETAERKRVEKALENSLSLHRATLEATADGILAIDKEGNVISLNHKFADMWQTPTSVMRSESAESIWDFILRRLDDPDEMLNKISELYAQPDFESHDEVQLNDGRIFEVHSHPQLIAGRGVGRVWSFRDITDRKKSVKALQDSEEQLREHKDHLEELVAERTARLEKANSSLREEIQERIQVQNELKTSEEQLRKLSAYLESTREEERIRIARELHDELGQSLSMLRVELDSLEHQVPAELGKTLIERTQSMSDMVGATIQKTREICQKLRPSVLDDLGFAAALDWQIEEFEKRTGIKCSLSIKSEDFALEQDSANALFRVFQEALTNVLRHSKATEVTSILEERNGKLWLKIKDNGSGMMKKEISGSKSLGLLGMRERIHFLNGNLKIYSKPGKGTSITINIPIKRQGQTNGQRINY